MAQDCGPISNPAGLRNQIEGGILQGMSRALSEEVTWDDRQVTSIDWSTYHSLRLGIEVPVIECVLINRSDVEATEQERRRSPWSRPLSATPSSMLPAPVCGKFLSPLRA